MITYKQSVFPIIKRYEAILMKKKIGVIFGGQGLQHLGMYENLLKQYVVAKKVFETASDIVGYDVKKACFEISDKTLQKNIYNQVCIITIELAMLEVLREQGISYNATAGFSLGEYAALVAGNVLSVEETIRLVRLRVCAMEQKVPDNIGGMLAIIDIPIYAIEILCNAVNRRIIISNYNSYSQTVVAGLNEDLAFISREVQKLGGVAVPLHVSKPFHHPLMKPAADLFYEELNKSAFGEPDCPIYSNVTGVPYQSKLNIKQLLYKQIFMPVQWVLTIQTMLTNDIGIFVELSPKSILSPFIYEITEGNAEIVTFSQVVR